MRSSKWNRSSRCRKPRRVPSLRLLGVVDLLNGRAVHAVAGRREAYQPHPESGRCSPHLERLLAGYRQFGVAGTYLADLDAIRGGELQAARLRDALPRDQPVWIDAGITSLDDFRRKRAALPLENLRWIVATETFAPLFADRRSLPADLAAFLAESPITIGIDLRFGQLRRPPAISRRSAPLGCTSVPLDCTSVPLDCTSAPLDFVRRLLAAGVDSFLPLEITSVGTNQGPATLEICRQIRSQSATVELLSGGGVRHSDDAGDLHAAGCDYVLAATAVLNGKIRPPEVEQNRFPTVPPPPNGHYKR